jgi:hypothetical protein
MLLKRYNITISEKNVSRAVIKQDIKDMYEANKAILVKLFNEKINQVEELDRIDTTELRNISRDKLREFKSQTQDSFPDVQL